MPLAQLFLQGVLLPEAVGVAHQWVSEDVTGFAQNGNFVTFVQLASLVAADDCVVHESSVPRQVFEYRDRVSAFALVE
jgi:hypothetical protein